MKTSGGAGARAKTGRPLQVQPGAPACVWQQFPSAASCTEQDVVKWLPSVIPLELHCCVLSAHENTARYSLPQAPASAALHVLTSLAVEESLGHLPLSVQLKPPPPPPHPARPSAAMVTKRLRERWADWSLSSVASLVERVAA